MSQQPPIRGSLRQPFLEQAAVQVTSHQGPIPSPDTIAGYEKTLVGAADRIIKMAEKEQENRHQVARIHQSHQFILTIVGQFLAFFMGAGGLSGGIYLVARDKPITGFSVFFASLGVLAGIYLFNRKNPPKPVDRKSED